MISHVNFHDFESNNSISLTEPNTRYRERSLFVPTIFVITSQPRVIVTFVDQSYLPINLKPFQNHRFHWLIAHPGVTVFLGVCSLHLLQKLMVRLVAGAQRKLTTALCFGRKQLLALLKLRDNMYCVRAVFFSVCFAFFLQVSCTFTALVSFSALFAVFLRCYFCRCCVFFAHFRLIVLLL